MDRAALTRTLTYVQANLDGDVSLDALAAAAFCSPPYLGGHFTQLMAETPKRFTSRLRLERAWRCGWGCSTTTFSILLRLRVL